MPLPTDKTFSSPSTRFVEVELVADLPNPALGGPVLGDRALVRSTGDRYTIVATDAPGNPLVWQLDPGGVSPTLSSVLAAGNVTGAHDILQTVGQKLDTATAGTLNLGTATATDLAMGTAIGVASTFRLLINQGGAPINSNAGIQYSSTFANRGAIRVNQYGANAGVPGLTGFKSRGATVGADAAVIVGDTLARMTGIGITGNGVDRPLSGIAGFQVTAVNANSLGTEFAVETVANDGAINSHRPVFAAAGSGLLRVREDANSMSGIAVTGAGGTVVVANSRITANTRVQLTIQDGGAVPTASVYVSARVVGTSFTIQSFAAGDVGVRVYYQLWEPLP